MMPDFFHGWQRKPVDDIGSMLICVVVIIGLAFALHLPKVTSHPVPKPADAKMLLKMADEVLKDGDEPIARSMFKRIVDDYGDTPTAQEAKERLDRIGTL